MKMTYNLIRESYVNIYNRKLNVNIPRNKIWIQRSYNTYLNNIYNIDDITYMDDGKLIFDNNVFDADTNKVQYIDTLLNRKCVFYPFTKESEYLMSSVEGVNIYSYMEYFKSGKYKDAYVICVLEDDSICYYINRDIYREIFMNEIVNNTRANVERTRLVFSILLRKRRDENEYKCELELNNVLNSKVKSCLYEDVELPELNLCLYNYQKRDIMWMSEIKENIDRGDNKIEILYNCFDKIEYESCEYIVQGRRLIKTSEINIEKNKYDLYYKGGNIITEVGLGKSIIILSYIIKNFKNNYDKFVLFDQNNCNYFYKRGMNGGESCKKAQMNNELYCKKHMNTLFIDKRITKLNVETRDELKDLDINIEIMDINKNIRNLIKTNASIIFCPNHLCDQWVREYYKNFKQDEKSKRVILIVTYDQYKNLKFREILFADIIIVSLNFLKNINYVKKSKKTNVKSSLISGVIDILEDRDENLKILDNFYYENIIVDEIHELDTNTLDIILNFNSKYRWNVSATPFTDSVNSFVNNMSNIMHDIFIRINMKKTIIINPSIIREFSELFRRNTRESIKDEYSGIILKNSLKLLNFTEQERRIYDSYNINKSINTVNFLIKFCCDSGIDADINKLIKNCKTLGEIEKALLDNNKNKLNKLKDKIKVYENDIKILEDKKDKKDEKDEEFVSFMYNLNVISSIEHLNIVLGNTRRSLTCIQKEFTDVEKIYTFLKNAIDDINIIETCPICLDDIQDITITNCGHKFCHDCIEEYVQEMRKYNKIKCPKCNLLLEYNEIYYLIGKSDYSQGESIDDLIQKVKSTKIGNIIYYIKNNISKDDKCIIFSQWDLMLTKIIKLLNDNNIQTLSCTGNVYNKRQSIKLFQENSNINLICLSSANCASGVNLTCANKIILIEPVYGSKQYRIDTENQAIGRSNRIGNINKEIEIIRFIIKDTIENEIYMETFK